MNTEEIIELAYSEIGALLGDKAELEIRLGTDDGGRTLDFHLIGEDNAATVRREISNFYHGFRTIIIFSYEPDYELNEEDVII